MAAPPSTINDWTPLLRRSGSTAGRSSPRGPAGTCRTATPAARNAALRTLSAEVVVTTMVVSPSAKAFAEIATDHGAELAERRGDSDAAHLEWGAHTSAPPRCRLIHDIGRTTLATGRTPWTGGVRHDRSRRAVHRPRRVDSCLAPAPGGQRVCSSSGAQPAGRGDQPHPGMTPPARVYGWPVAFGGYVAVVDGARSSA